MATATVQLPAHAADWRIICDLSGDCGRIPSPGASGSPVTYVHNNDQQLYYRLETHTLQTAQRAAINQAATIWNTKIGKTQGGMNILWSANYTDSTPGPDGGNNIWEGTCTSIVPTCVDGFAIAYTVATDADGNKHYETADMAFDESQYWDTDGNECSVPGDNSQYTSSERDVLAGTDNRADQLTWALHEMGHFGRLTDSEFGGIMNNDRRHYTCEETITDYDSFWMYANYEGEGANGAAHHVNH